MLSASFDILPRSPCSLLPSIFRRSFLPIFAAPLSFWRVSFKRFFGADAPYRRVGFQIPKWHTRVQKIRGRAPPPPREHMIIDEEHYS